MTDLFPTMGRCDAHISNCGLYRYTLHRSINNNFYDAEDSIAFVMLNPSTADAQNDDPTIRRCIDYAIQWGFHSLLVLNIFAYRSTDPRNLKLANDPVGPLNHDSFTNCLPDVSEVICAWGNHGNIKVDGAPQSEWALGWIEAAGRDPMALRVTKRGQPAHPLYLPKTLEPKPFT